MRPPTFERGVLHSPGKAGEFLEQMRKIIESLAGLEGMTPEDIENDMVTFACDVNGAKDDLMGYFAEIAEKTGATYEELIAYALIRGQALGRIPPL
jgi:hypothetical protein